MLIRVYCSSELVELKVSLPRSKAIQTHSVNHFVLVFHIEIVFGTALPVEVVSYAPKTFFEVVLFLVELCLHDQKRIVIEIAIFTIIVRV